MTDETMLTSELSVTDFREIAAEVEREVAKVIVGQRDVVRHVLIGILSGGHVLLEGVPGLGKTMLVRAFAQAMNLHFSRIQFTPDLMPADITGTDIMEEAADGRRQFRFQQGPVFANLILADEINRATPKTQSALLEAMQEQTVTVATHTYPLPAPFFVLATQNPIEQEGTYPLPEAQLDRFLFKINVGFPSAEELAAIVTRTTGKEVAVAETAVSGPTISAMQQFARQIPIATPVTNYVSRLIVASHPGGSPSALVNSYVRYGASPRGAQALVLGGKITALLDGRLNVSYEDITAVTPAALRHRLLLNFEGQAEGIRPDDVVADLVAQVKRE